MPHLVSITDVKIEPTGQLLFMMRNTDDLTARKLRDYLMTDLETLAINDVQFVINESILEGHVLAGRIGQFPIRCEQFDQLLRPTECCQNPDNINPSRWDKYCGKCSVRFEIDVTAPMVGYTPLCNVNLKQVGQQESNIKAAVQTYQIDQDICNDLGVPFRDMEVLEAVKIFSGQRVKAICYATKGNGAMHAKFAPVTPIVVLKKGDCGCRFNFLFKIEIIRQYYPEEMLEIIQTWLNQRQTVFNKMKTWYKNQLSTGSLSQDKVSVLNVDQVLKKMKPMLDRDEILKDYQKWLGEYDLVPMMLKN